MEPVSKLSSDVERLLESVGVGLWQWDGRTNTLTLDSTCRRIFDLQPGETPTNKYLASLLTEEDRFRYQQALADCIEHGHFYIEYRIRCRDGQTRFISGRGHTMPGASDRARVIQGVFIDITQNRELEDRLRNSESRMAQLADGIPGLFCYIDRDCRVQFMNSRYREIIGALDEPVIGRHIAELVGPDSFSRRRKRYERAFAGETVLFETSVPLPGGEDRFFTIRHHPHRDETGEVQGIMTLAMDITERHAAETALERQSTELARSNHDLEQFAYVASHDLKAPLRSIDILIQWLREDLGDYDEGDVQENLGLVAQRAGRLNRLLDNLLAYSRAGQRSGDVTPTDTQLMVLDIAVLLAPSPDLNIDADPSLPTITTCHAPLEQVLRNLIHNAIQHHPTGCGRVRVYARDQGDRIMFAVEDDGAGIPAEYAEKVFEMFQTLQPRDEREGSGMGLAICQRIIDGQGGRIWLHSGPADTGAVFKFTWPKTPLADLTAVHGNESAADEKSGDGATRQTLAG